MDALRGMQVILATGAEITESNREIFSFSRSTKSQKIGRFLFEKGL